MPPPFSDEWEAEWLPETERSRLLRGVEPSHRRDVRAALVGAARDALALAYRDLDVSLLAAACDCSFLLVCVYARLNNTDEHLFELLVARNR